MQSLNTMPSNNLMLEIILLSSNDMRCETISENIKSYSNIISLGTHREHTILQVPYT